MSATLSHALVSSMRPPSTACSDSMECGGVRTSAMEPRSRRALTASATYRSGKSRARLLFGDDRHGQRHVHVCMQMQIHGVLADGTQRPTRLALFTTLDLEVLALERLRDVRSADGAEQLAFGARLRADGELEILERNLALFGGAQLVARRFLELCAPLFELRDVRRCSQCRLALRQQVVPAEARLHLDAIADVAAVGNLLQKNDFHWRGPQCWS